MFFWFVMRIIAYQAYAILLVTGVTLGTAWIFSVGQIDDAYEREVRSLRSVSIGEDDDKRLPVEVRAQRVASYIRSMVDRPKSQESHGIVGDGIDETVTGFLNRPAVVNFKTSVLRFLPLGYIRLETYYSITLLLTPFLLIAWLLGTSRSKGLVGEGYHKRNFLPHYLRYSFWFVRDALVAGAGFVLMPAVVWWVLPAFLLSCFMIYVWRAYSIAYL